MVKKRQQPTRVGEDHDDDISAAVDDVDLADVRDDDVALLLSDLVDGGGGTVRIEQYVPGGTEYVDEWDAAAFTLRDLQQQCGGGRYRLIVKDAARRYRWSKTVRVAVPIRPPVPPPDATEKLSGLDRIAALMVDQLEQQRKLLEVLVMRATHPPAAAPAVSADAIRSQLLSDMQAMRQIIGGGEDKGAGADKLIDALKLGVELARDSGGGGDSDGLMPLIGKVVDTFGEPLAAALAARSSAVSPAPAPAPVVAPPAITQQKPKPEKKSMNMRQAIGFLVEKAAAGADCTLYADLILDNVPAALLAPIVEGDVVTKLSQVDPRVLQHSEWFRELGEVVKEALSDAVGIGAESATGIVDAGEYSGGT